MDYLLDRWTRPSKTNDNEDLRVLVKSGIMKDLNIPKRKNKVDDPILKLKNINKFDSYRGRRFYYILILSQENTQQISKENRDEKLGYLLLKENKFYTCR